MMDNIIYKIIKQHQETLPLQIDMWIVPNNTVSIHKLYSRDNSYGNKYDNAKMEFDIDIEENLISNNIKYDKIVSKSTSKHLETKLIEKINNIINDKHHQRIIIVIDRTSIDLDNGKIATELFDEFIEELSNIIPLEIQDMIWNFYYVETEWKEYIDTYNSPWNLSLMIKYIVIYH